MNSKVLFGAFLLLVFLSCASMSYTYYGLAPNQDGVMEGTLLAKDPSGDQPIAICNPDANQKGKCVVLLIDEWERVLSDIVSLQDQLKACQNGK